MGGGLVLLGLTISVIAYALLNIALPKSARIVPEMNALRNEWQSYYGWIYLEKPLAAIPPRGLTRLSASIIDAFHLRRFLEIRLDKAGSEMAPEVFLFRHVLVLIALGGLFAAIAAPAVTVAVVVTVAYLPFLIMSIQATRRTARIEEQLADTLQLIAGLLRAGHGFSQALAAVTRETEPPISLVLRRVSSHIRLGGSLENALDKIAVEVDSIAIRWTVTAIKIQREVGGNLSEILDILAQSIRERSELGRQVKALTAEGRFSAYILLLMPFVIIGILYFSNREYLALLLDSSAGRSLMYLAGFFMLIGVVWLRKIVRVEV